MHMMMTVF